MASSPYIRVECASPFHHWAVPYAHALICRLLTVVREHRHNGGRRFAFAVAALRRNPLPPYNVRATLAGGISGNAINGISEKNVKGPIYLDKANQEFGGTS